MNLAQYIKANAGEATRLASVLRVSKGRISQIAGGAPTSLARAVEIEKATGGAVRCEDLMPNIDWAYLRTPARKRTPTPKEAAHG